MDVDVDTYVGALRRDVRWLIEEESGQPHSQSEHEHARDKDVVVVVMSALLHKGAAAWPFVVSAIEAAADDDDVLRYIGAGDLESLVMWHGDELIDEIETRAAESSRESSAQSGVVKRVGLRGPRGTDRESARCPRSTIEVFDLGMA